MVMMFAFLLPLVSRGQQIGVRGGDVKGPVQIIADQVEHDRAANTYTARGNVEVREATRTLFADYIFLDDNTRDVTAEGNVIYEDLGDRIEAERMQLNLETKKGTLEKARVYIKTGNVYVNGAEIEKTGESQYKIKKGKFTTCGWDKPEWTFTSDEVDITVEGYAKTKSTTFHILGVPVFYIPWGIFPVKAQRQSGFLIPEMALSSADGAKFKLSYFWAIAKDKDATMSAARAFAAEAHRTERDVEIIIDDQDVFRFDLVEAGKGGNRPTTVVHPRLGLCQDDTAPFDQTVGSFRIVLGAGKAEAVGTGHGFDGAEPDVVTIVRVAWPGIPETGNEGELAQALRFRFDCLR